MEETIMDKKKLFACGLAAVMSLGLAACGGDDSGAGADQPAETPAPVETAAPEETAPAETTAPDGLAEDSLFSILNDEDVVLVPDWLAGSSWEFMGGYLDGENMEQADYDAALEQYGGTLQLDFTSDSEVDMVQGGGTLNGTYYVTDDSLNLGIDFPDNDLKYAAMFFTQDGGESCVLALLSDETGRNAIFFTPVAE